MISEFTSSAVVPVFALSNAACAIRCTVFASVNAPLAKLAAELAVTNAPFANVAVVFCAV